jgi:hypothetical protein
VSLQSSGSDGSRIGAIELSIRLGLVKLADVESRPATEPVPVWLLDVDGVLNADRPGWSGLPGHGTAKFEGHVFRMRWAPRLIVQLIKLHRDHVVEFRWATTWVDEIGQIEALFRLPGFPLAFSGLSSGPQSQVPGLKGEAALHVVETERRPLIWTDDDAIPLGGPLRRRLHASQPLMLIAPDPNRGLQPADIQAVTEFLANPGATERPGS